MALTGGLGDPSRRCKRMTVVLCAVAHLVVTLFILSVFLGPSSQGSASLSTPLSDYLRRLNPYKLQGRNLTKLQSANRKADIEFRRQSAPLILMGRVKEIEAEVAKSFQGQVSANAVEKTEQEELQEQVELEIEQGLPAVEDDALGVIQRGIPPEKCYPEPHTDFGGVSVRWGLTYHLSSAAECCKACSRQAAYAKAGQRKCNVWVFCPENKGCPSPDGYEHKFGECWLKQADQPRAFVNDYSLLMRDKSVPPIPVLWISGVTPFNGE